MARPSDGRCHCPSLEQGHRLRCLGLDSVPPRVPFAAWAWPVTALRLFPGWASQRSVQANGEAGPLLLVGAPQLGRPGPAVGFLGGSEGGLLGDFPGQETPPFLPFPSLPSAAPTPSGRSC